MPNSGGQKSVEEVGIEALSKRVDRLERHIDMTLEKIFQELKDLRGRLPTWATLLLSFVTMLLGACVTSYFR